ncbi:MAG: hypothetical protein RL745_84 [Actinomycetota bacterium]|jgi:pyruvate dehydrogenase E1 component beta subunit
MATLTMAKAINTGLRHAMKRDDKVVLMGEDIGKLGGVFRVTDGLQAEFGDMRVVDPPLAESGIVGTAVGMAMRGWRPVVEIQFDGFVYPAFDQIVSQVAKQHYRSAGKTTLSMVIRIPYGGGIGAIEHHSESPEAYFAHTAGLRVISPANPIDAYEMIQQAIAHPDPVIFFEPKRRYWDKAEIDDSVDVMDRPEGYSQLFDARIAREGSDLTLVAYGPMVKTCLEAAAAAANEGLNLEVLDLRSLTPLDFETVVRSVTKTGRMVVVHEAPQFAGIGAEIAARVTEKCFWTMQAPVLRVAGLYMPYPAARVEHAFLPDLDRILDAVDKAMEY